MKKKLDKAALRNVCKNLMRTINDKNDTLYDLRQQHAINMADALERKDGVINNINMALNGKDDTIHNLRRALHKRDLSVDNMRSQVCNLQEKLGNLHDAPINPDYVSVVMEALNADIHDEDKRAIAQGVLRIPVIAKQLCVSTEFVQWALDNKQINPAPSVPVARIIRAKAAKAKRRGSLIYFIMRDSALMASEGYSNYVNLAALEEKLCTMSMEELEMQLKASVITASCR